MATVWELVTASSTLPEQNDFWDHLNNLGSGIGECSGIVLYDGLEIEMECTEKIAELDLSHLEVEVEFVVEVELDSTEYEVEVCNV